jgi:hypothetical protein
MTKESLIKRLETTCLGLDPIDPLRLLVDDVVEALREHAMREVQRLGQEIEQEPVVGIAAIRTWFKDGRVVTQTLCNSWIDTTPPQRTEQEPVAYWKEHAQGLQRDYDSLLAEFQAQRTWADLTDEEILHRIDTHVGVPSQKYPLDISDLISFARAIEHESKGKNI